MSEKIDNLNIEIDLLKKDNISIDKKIDKLNFKMDNLKYEKNELENKKRSNNFIILKRQKLLVLSQPPKESISDLYNKLEKLHNNISDDITIKKLTEIQGEISSIRNILPSICDHRLIFQKDGYTNYEAYNEYTLPDIRKCVICKKEEEAYKHEKFEILNNSKDRLVILGEKNWDKQFSSLSEIYDIFDFTKYNIYFR